MKHIKIFVFAAFALVSTIIVRAIQLLHLTDFKTGFYKAGLESLGAGLMVFLVITIALASSLIFIFKTQRLYTTPSSTPLATAMLFAGLANIAEPFLGGASLSAVPVTLLGIRAFLILASGFVFCYFGIAMLNDRKIKPSLSIVLIVGWVVRLMTTFICFSKMSNISENLYDVLMLVFTLVFLLFFGKAICGVSTSKTNKRFFATGIAAVLFSAASSIPCILTYFFDDIELIHAPIDSPVTGIFVASFISVYLIEICRQKEV